MFFIDWISQSAVALYIYRVGWTYPARNPFYRSRSTKIVIVLGLLFDWSDRSDPCGQATTPDRSDRLVRPVDANFGYQHMPPYFFW